MKDPRYPYALDLGSEVGGYRIEAVLGAGGFGITYRARNDVTGKTVAIKEFYVRDISTRTGSTVQVDTTIDEGTYEYALRKFMDEAHAVVSRFDHPYIIKGENFLNANRTSYLVMDYIDGYAYEDWLTAHSGAPDEAELRSIFEKVFSAVDYVHDHNTMHRDLTPRNIMIGRDGNPMLIDFGAAGQGIDRGRSSKMVAQMRYAPPEQTDENGPGIHGRYTDIFSLGGVLYRSISGKPPMAPLSRVVRMGRRDSGVDPHVPAREAAIDPSLYSEEFLAGIDRALRLDERERPQSIAELRMALGWASDPSETVFLQTGDDATRWQIAPHLTEVLPPDSVTVPVMRGARKGAGALHEDPDIAAVLAPSSRPRRLAPWIALVVLAGVGIAGWPWIEDVLITDKVLPPVTPYETAFAVTPSTVTLSGYLPTRAERTGLAGELANALPGRALADHTRLAEGAPATFPAGTSYAIGLLKRLAEGKAGIVNTQVSVEGRVRALEDIEPLRAALATPPVGLTIASERIVAAAGGGVTECDRDALPPDHPDLPQGVKGTVFEQIDGAAAVDSCRAARTERPNVARFATGLGIGLQRTGEIDQAMVAFRLAAEADDRVAMERLADHERTRPGGDMGRMVALYRRAAEHGDPGALFELGRMSERGTGVPKDIKAAVAAYEKAAATGHAYAHYRLGQIARTGANGPVDTGRAIDSFAIAAAAGRIDAKVALAEMLLEPGTGRGDPVRAAALLEDASAAGYAPAQHDLGIVLLRGSGRPKDPVAGMALLEKAASTGRTASMVELGLAWQTGAAGTIDYDKAYDWFQRASASDPRAMHQLGWMFETGLGRPVDHARAFDWYLKAANLGQPESLHQLGSLYEGGRGRPVDFARAAEWYGKAAALGDANAINQLGWFAQNGLGRTRDDAEAFALYQKAAGAGSAAASWNAAVLIDAGRVQGADMDKAAEFLVAAVQRREPAAVEAMTGDMAGFSAVTRAAVKQRLMRVTGLSMNTDPTWDAESRRTVLRLLN